VTKGGVGTGTVTSSPAGINCGSTCVATYANGTSVSLTAHAGSRSRFNGWSGDCSGRGSCVLSMTANHSVRATFGRIATPPACVVPSLVGKSVATAAGALVRAHCRLGKVSRVSSSRAKKGKVLAQGFRAGRHLPNGTKVNIVVGRGPARRG
jgi:hypothetical protein